MMREKKRHNQTITKKIVFRICLICLTFLALQFIASSFHLHFLVVNCDRIAGLHIQ